MQHKKVGKIKYWCIHFVQVLLRRVVWIWSPQVVQGAKLSQWQHRNLAKGLDVMLCLAVLRAHLAVPWESLLVSSGSWLLVVGYDFYLNSLCS
jgi:hypothetical protein